MTLNIKTWHIYIYIYMQALTTFQKEFIASKDTECLIRTSFVQPQENIANLNTQKI